MKKSILLIIFMLLMVSPSLAIVKHSTETIIDYKKYYTLIQKYPQSKYYHFEFAIILASMGKIESAGKEFNIINQIDESYANKMVNYLENQVKLKPDWKNYFRLGFCYFFI